MGRERMLLHPIFHFTGTRLLSEISRKCLLCILQYRSPVKGTGTRYIDSLNWKLQSQSSMTSRVEFRELSFGGLSTYFWPALQISLKTSKPKETELNLCIFKSSLFISLIKCPIVSFFNYKLWTRLSCPLLPLSGPQLALSGLQN